MPRSRVERINDIEPTYQYITLRWLEFILSVACLFIGIFLSVTFLWIPLLALIPVAVIFTFITGVYVIFDHLINPPPLKTWLLFSFTAFSLFFAGAIACIIVLVKFINTIFVIMGIVLFAVTAIVFLIDFMYAMLLNNKLRKLQRRKVLHEKHVDVAVTACGPIQHEEAPPIRRLGSKIVPCNEMPTQKSCSRPIPSNEIPITHGGTFAVGKDLTPISPDTSRVSKSSATEPCNCGNDDAIVKATKFERKRSISTCSAPPVAAKGQCVRYAIKISPSKMAKSLCSARESPRISITKPEPLDCCASCQCLPGEVHREIESIQEQPNISPTVSEIEVREEKPSVRYYSRCMRPELRQPCPGSRRFVSDEKPPCRSPEDKPTSFGPSEDKQVGCRSSADKPIKRSRSPQDNSPNDSQ